MSQTTIEKSATARAQSNAKQADPVTEQRAIIIRQLTELHGAVSVRVGWESGGPVGRVLAHAGSILARVMIDFASDNTAEDRGHADAVEAEAFIQAAAALCDEEKKAKQVDAGTAAAVRKLVGEIDAICNALESFNKDNNRPQSPRPAESAPAPSQSLLEERHQHIEHLDFGKDAARVGVALDATYQIETLVCLLLFVGNLDHEEATALHLPTVVKTMGVRIEKLNAAIMSALGDQGPNGFDEVQFAVHGGSSGQVHSRLMVPA